jgi:hypothetical protein
MPRFTRQRCRRQPHKSCLALSMTEVMVSVAIGGVLASSMMTMNALTLGTLKNSANEEITKVAINRDLETIKARMNSYTWCSGAGTILPTADTTRCRTSNKANKAYYYPGNSNDKLTFATACDDNVSSNANRFLAPLIFNLNTLAVPQGASRTVTVADGSLKTVQVTYSSANLRRSMVMTPTAAAWCQ